MNTQIEALKEKIAHQQDLLSWYEHVAEKGESNDERVAECYKKIAKYGYQLEDLQGINPPYAC